MTAHASARDVGRIAAAAARRVRAYVGLGANLGDAAATLAAGIHALAALPGARLAGVSRLYATAPVGVVDQPEFRNAVVALDVPAGPDPETGGARPAGRAQGAGARLRPPGPRALGAPRARPRPAGLRPPRAPRGAPARRPQRRPGDARPCSGCRCPTRPPGSASSCSPRWPTWRPACGRPAGARRSTARPAPSARARTRSPDRALGRAAAGWVTLRAGRPPTGQFDRGGPGPRSPARRGFAELRPDRPRPRWPPADPHGARSPGGRPRLPPYSRTAGGRSRSNMWTVSTKRTCLVW